MGSVLYLCRRRIFTTILTAAGLCAIFLWIERDHSPSSTASHLPRPLSSPSHSLPIQSTDIYIDLVAHYFINYPINTAKSADRFGELGKRVQILRGWIAEMDASKNSGTQKLVEEVVMSMFPFLRNPSKP